MGDICYHTNIILNGHSFVKDKCCISVADINVILCYKYTVNGLRLQANVACLQAPLSIINT